MFKDSSLKRGRICQKNVSSVAETHVLIMRILFFSRVNDWEKKEEYKQE